MDQPQRFSQTPDAPAVADTDVAKSFRIVSGRQADTSGIRGDSKKGGGLRAETDRNSPMSANACSCNLAEIPADDQLSIPRNAFTRWSSYWREVEVLPNNAESRWSLIAYHDGKRIAIECRTNRYRKRVEVQSIWMEREWD
ncbi:hypothetical protein Enr13x_28190 [Stieleria neptunia]|uniref:Uncharacterized protein n=1 Tax=Stieleria neptunia TaxID=2527979 RepID=A0A518HQ92_9BACT|nr:hypothetical protein Enr13x_28190 [Stieleria neptunia]